jgi:hypothetical protein
VLARVHLFLSDYRQTVAMYSANTPRPGRGAGSARAWAHQSQPRIKHRGLSGPILVIIWTHKSNSWHVLFKTIEHWSWSIGVSQDCWYFLLVYSRGNILEINWPIPELNQWEGARGAAGQWETGAAESGGRDSLSVGDTSLTLVLSVCSHSRPLRPSCARLIHSTG